MLSGKSQYYNAVRKESFKAMNSVSFCASATGNQAVLGWWATNQAIRKSLHDDIF
jgi:hypothetical protein